MPRAPQMNLPEGVSLETASDDPGSFTAEGRIKERPQKVKRDAFYISPDLQKQAGIDPETHVGYWARDPRKWEKIEMNDRVEQLRGDFGDDDGGMNAEVCRGKDADFITRGADLVLMKIPRHVSEANQAEIDRAAEEYRSEFRRVEGEGYVANRNLFDRDGLAERMIAEHERNKITGFGMGNSPTAGMSWAEAQWVMRNRQAEVERRQQMLREGGETRPMSREDFSAMMTGEEVLKTKEKAQALRTKTTVGMGDSGFPRNPKSPLAQAQARERR